MRENKKGIIPCLGLMLFVLLVLGSFDVHAGCSPFIGRVAINEIDVHNQSGNAGPYFVELKALDSSILSSTPPLWQNWTMDICSEPGDRDGTPCQRNIPVGGGILQYNWLVIDQNIIQWDYLDLNDGKKHGMEVVLYDENDDVVDYLSVNGYSVDGSSGCSFPYDTTYGGGNNFNIQRQPDGIGDWETTGSGNSGVETENDTNDPVPAGSPNLSVADAIAPSGSIMTFTLELSATSTTDVIIEYATQDATAVGGADYISKSGNITIPAGSLSVDLQISTLVAAQGGSYFYLILSEVSSSNAVILNNIAKGTIVVSPLAEFRFEGCDWTTGAVVIDELGNHNGQVVQGAHTAPGVNFGGGLCNVADLHNEGTDYNRYISLASNPISLNSDWTLMMWINFPPGFDRHFQYSDYRYSVIAGGTHNLAWIREHTTNGTRYWGASSNPNAHLAPFPSTLTGWHHLAFVGNGANTDLYVDGAFYNSVDYKQTGSYTRMGTTADSVNTNARQNLDTQLDELKFYDGALLATEISSIYNLENSGLRWDGSPLNCSLCGIVDHYRIEHTGVGLTCQRSDVTLRACSDSNCGSEYAYPVTVTMTPATFNPPTWIGGDTQTFTGHDVVQLRQTLPGSVSLGLINPDHVPTNGYKCYDSGVEGDCDITFYDSGFIYDVPDLTSCQTSSNISIQAVRMDDTTQTCVADGGFANANKTVNFWSTYVNPGSGTEQVSLSGTNVAVVSPGTGIPLNFDVNATANFTVTYPDTGQMQLNARYDGVGAEEAGLVMFGSDSFIARPVGLCIYSDDANADCAAGNGSCSVFKRVDEAFNLKVKGVCWESSGDTDFCSGNSTTPNFQLSSIPITHSLVAPSGGSAGNIGVSSINISAADTGEHIISNQTVSEVGGYTFIATPPDYFGTSLPVASSVNIGRFTPDHYATSITDNGILQDACSGFTYSGQDFSYVPPNFPEMLITATGSAGNTTVNYRDDFVKLTNPATQINMPAVTADSSNLGADAATLLNLTWAPAASSLIANNDGTLDFTLGADQFTYTREPNALVAPFTSDIQLSVVSISDSDGVSATGLPSLFLPTGTEIRYGQMQLQNAYGPETLPLTIPVLTEYYDGSGFVLNSLDNCSTYDFLHLIFSNLQGNLASGETLASGNGTLLSGLGSNLSLSAPGVGNDGSVDLEYDLDAAGLSWLKPGGNNPRAKATFGIFKGNQRLIYMRESIW
ncbi:MAG: hypothetical protein PF441_11120 [Desulfuromusa sp.]|jgi:MSHA biogenesis protein MshQ|nr:hypothetical protein [Desulfuromusa sp.]